MMSAAIPQQFNLTLTSRWKATALSVGGMGLLVLVVAAVIGTVGRYWPALAGVIVAGLLFGWIFWFIPKAATLFCAEAAVAVLDAEGLAVYFPNTGTTRRIGFADMVSYSFSLDTDITVRPRQEPALHLHLNHKLHPQGLVPLMQFQLGLRWAVADYQQRHPGQPPIRELGFFARPVAVVVLGLFGALLAWLGWQAFQPAATEGTWGGFLFAGLMFTIYALTWWHHRQQPE